MVTKPRPDAQTCGASGAREATPQTAQARTAPDGEPISPRDAMSGVGAPIVPVTLGKPWPAGPSRGKEGIA